MTCKITTGKIYKIPFPFTDLTETKIRPALAITDSHAYGDAEFLFITQYLWEYWGLTPFFLCDKNVANLSVVLVRNILNYYSDNDTK